MCSDVCQNQQNDCAPSEDSDQLCIRSDQSRRCPNKDALDSRLPCAQGIFFCFCCAPALERPSVVLLFDVI